MRIGKAALAALVLLIPSAASAMTVAEFVAKADAAQKRGMMALLSPDIGLLKTERMNAGKVLRAEQTAAEAAHRRGATCMPHPAPMNSDELLAYWHAIPPAGRSISVKQGLAAFMNRKYPCPA